MLKAATKLGLPQQGAFFVPRKDYKLLRECFSRWLSADLCRQPHHPPKLALKLPKGEPTTEAVCIHIAAGISVSGCSIMSILAYPTTGYARHRLACALFETQGHTLSCPDAILHLMADSGGHCHQQPFHILIGYGKETVTITTSYEKLSISLDEMGFIFKKAAEGI